MILPLNFGFCDIWSAVCSFGPLVEDGCWHTKARLVKVSKLLGGCSSQCAKENLTELHLLSIKDDDVEESWYCCLISYLIGGSREGGCRAWCFPEVHKSKWAQVPTWEIQHREIYIPLIYVCIYICMYVYKRVVTYQNSLPREAVVTQSFKIFVTGLDMAWSNVLSWGLPWAESNAADLQKSLTTYVFLWIVIW